MSNGSANSSRDQNPSPPIDQEIFDAIQAGDADRVRALLATDSDRAAARDGRGVPALITALYFQNSLIADLLAEHLDDLSFLEAAAMGRSEEVARALDLDPERHRERSVDGFTALHYGAFFCRPKVVDQLLARGAEVGAVAANAMKVQPLNSAVAAGCEAVVERLLAAGADPNARQQLGVTPLMGAAASGRRPLVDRLLAAGADPAAVDESGKTAADWARERGAAAVAEFLEAL